MKRAAALLCLLALAAPAAPRTPTPRADEVAAEWQALKTNEAALAGALVKANDRADAAEAQAAALAARWDAACPGVVLPEGAVPNDGKDDYEALQAALNRLKDGGTFVLPGGPADTYDVSRTLRIKGAVAFTIRGHGAVIRPTPGHAGGDLVRLDACVDFALHGLRLDGNRQVLLPRPSATVRLSGCVDFAIRGCAFTDARWDHLRFEAGNPADPATACRDGVVEGCTFLDAPRCGVAVIHARGLRLVGNVIKGVKGEAPETAVRVEQNPEDAKRANHDILILGNRIEDCARLGVWAGVGDPYRVTVAGNTFKGCPTPVHLIGNGHRVTDNNAAGTNAERAHAIGIVGDDGAVEGNEFSNGAWLGVSVKGTRNVVRGNAGRGWGLRDRGLTFTTDGPGGNVVFGNIAAAPAEGQSYSQAYRLHPQDRAWGNN